MSEFDDLSLVQLIVERGVQAVKALPQAIREKGKAAAETIENNVRKLIIDESPINPKYYERCPSCSTRSSRSASSRRSTTKRTSKNRRG